MHILVLLKFTPLEFETKFCGVTFSVFVVKIYSVRV